MLGKYFLRKFCFIVPLRNKATANVWDQTVRLCIETLASVSRQALVPSEVILVCSEFPDVVLPSNVTIIRSDFPNPKPNWQDQHVDKYNKIRRGLVELKKRNHEYYVMKFDADDLASDRLVPWVLDDDNKTGYVVTQGYRQRGRLFELVKQDFHNQCGSSNILFASPDQLPDSMSDNRKFDLLSIGHDIAVETFERRGTPLAPIPFPGVVYRLGHGENITAHYTPTDDPQAKPSWKFYAGKYLNHVKALPGNLRARRLRGEYYGDQVALGQKSRALD